MAFLKKRIHEIVEKASPGDRASKSFDYFIITLIALNILAVIIETLDGAAKFEKPFFVFEAISVAVFSFEYALRIWSCTSDEQYRHPIWGRIRYVFTPLALVDLLAILPFYLPMIITVDLRFLRALRLFRIFRIFKLGRYAESLQLLCSVFRQKKEELGIMLFVVIIMLVMASSTLYFIEHDAQPGTFSSIPAAMWWGIATLTTVGYGDVYPITAWGKLVGAVLAILGIGLFALPAGILASGFSEAIQKNKGNDTCPHCGKEIE